MPVVRIWWMLGWFQVAALLIATLWPAVALPGPEGSDKLVHLASFGWLMFWFAQVVVQRRWRLTLLLVGYGGLIELLQYFSGYRHGDVWDLLADCCGIFLAWAVVLWVSPNVIDRFSATVNG